MGDEIACEERGLYDDDDDESFTRVCAQRTLSSSTNQSSSMFSPK